VKQFFSMMMVSALVGCGVFGNDDVDEEAAEVYVGEWAIEALVSEEPEEIESPIDPEGELAIDDDLDADYSIVFADGPWAYEIQARGKVLAADGEQIEHELTGIVGRVPIEGGEPEVLEFLGQLQCAFLPGGLVCNVFGVAQDDEIEFDLDLQAELASIL